SWLADNIGFGRAPAWLINAREAARSRLATASSGLAELPSSKARRKLMESTDSTGNVFDTPTGKVCVKVGNSKGCAKARLHDNVANPSGRRTFRTEIS
ncbi:hypothetical protein OEZ82_26110, partial [Leclercia adecarboxylata]|uniref:hypothetical protein n=1 Tax=Leclercia adecarboxylata TaxID=83655 RepID=UPI00234C582F